MCIYIIKNNNNNKINETKGRACGAIREGVVTGQVEDAAGSNATAHYVTGGGLAAYYPHPRGRRFGHAGNACVRGKDGIYKGKLKPYNKQY